MPSPTRAVVPRRSSPGPPATPPVCTPGIQPGQDREAAFRRYSEVSVAYAVLEELEAERIAVPTFGEIVEQLCPLPSFEPSSN